MGQIEEGKGWFLGSCRTGFGETGVLDWGNNKSWENWKKITLGLKIGLV